jgi:hypothetical protein
MHCTLGHLKRDTQDGGRGGLSLAQMKLSKTLKIFYCPIFKFAKKQIIIKKIRHTHLGRSSKALSVVINMSKIINDKSIKYNLGNES